MALVGGAMIRDPCPICGKPRLLVIVLQPGKQGVKQERRCLECSKEVKS